jgi:phosphoribosylamine--glycine ligase
MNILVVGSGGREHALVWKICQSRRAEKVLCAPGNGGIASLARCVPVRADDIPGLVALARQEKIDLTVVGPEVPLVLGIVDAFEQAGLKAFGPSRAAARLEGSKVFAKEFMSRHGIPTARHLSFDRPAPARAALDGFSLPVVIKADGLAAGKGVVICRTRREAEEALEMIMSERLFKEAGSRVVIEEFLAGEEASILAVSDGKDFVLLDSSQDHKRVFDRDEGPNTGGMGAYSPAPVVTGELMRTIGRTVIAPVIEGMAQEGAPFKGVLYAGIMVTDQGPRVLEFNTRFGDPETEAVLPRLTSDLVDLMLASVNGGIGRIKLEWDPRACVCVVMASGGYPGHYEPGKVIEGLDKVSEDAVIFHAGTVSEGGVLRTSGGRVLGVTSLGADIAQAISRVYAQVAAVTFEGCHYRRDIGHRALGKL